MFAVQPRHGQADGEFTCIFTSLCPIIILILIKNGTMIVDKVKHLKNSVVPVTPKNRTVPTFWGKEPEGGPNFSYPVVFAPFFGSYHLFML